MSDRSITRLRTFYSDFERARNKAGLPKPKTSNTKGVDITNTGQQPAVKQATGSSELKILNEKPLPAPSVPTTTPKNITPKTPITPRTSSLPRPAVDHGPVTEKRPKPALKTAPIVSDKPIQKIVSDQLNVSELNKAKSDSILNGSNVFDVTAAEETGTWSGGIITDTKRKRFHLLPALIQAIKKWFYETETKIEKAQAPKHTVRPAEDRSSIIESASEKSVLAPKDDYEQVAKRLQSVKRITRDDSDLAIKEAGDIEPAHWAYKEDKAGESTLVIPNDTHLPAETGTPMENEVSNIEPERVLTPTASEAGVRATPSTVSEMDEPSLIPTVETVTPTLSDLGVNEEEIATPETVESPEVEADTPETVEEPLEATTPKPPLANRKVPAASTRPFRPNLSLVVVVMLLAIGLGVTSAFWIFGDHGKNVATTQSISVNTLIESNEQIPTLLTADRLAFFKNVLDTEPRTQSEIVVVYPTVNVQGSTEIATPTDILNVLQWRTANSFTRNITDINFGLWKNSEPFIVLKVTSFDIALSSMLAWEGNMSSDLAPLFGNIVAGTFDPNARNATQIREPYFVDTVLDNRDVRVLRDELYKDRIVYSFLDKNTILITNMSDGFRALAPYVK